MFTDLLFPLLVLEDAKVEDLNEVDEEDDDEDPNDDAVANRDLFVNDRMFDTFV